MTSAYRRKSRLPISRKQKLKNRSRKTQLMKKKKRYFKRGAKAKRKPVTKNGKTNNKKSNSPTLNDSKTLQQLRRDNMYMTTKAKGIMISFVKNLYKWVSVEAERLRRERKRTSIGFLEMQTALKSVMPGKCTKCMANTSKAGGLRCMKVS